MMGSDLAETVFPMSFGEDSVIGICELPNLTAGGGPGARPRVILSRALTVLSRETSPKTHRQTNCYTTCDKPVHNSFRITAIR